MDVRIPTSFGKAIAHDHVPEEDHAVFISSFAAYAADHRYYEITKATLGDQFEHRYLILKDKEERTRAVQPFLIVRQDLVMGTPALVAVILPLCRSIAT